MFEALKAYDVSCRRRGISIRVVDLYSLQPIDSPIAAAMRAAKRKRLITVEDHYAAGGIGDAVAAAVAGRAGSPSSASASARFRAAARPEQLLDRYGISARHIVAAVTGHPTQRHRGSFSNISLCLCDSVATWT